MAKSSNQMRTLLDKLDQLPPERSQSRSDLRAAIRLFHPHRGSKLRPHSRPATTSEASRNQ